VLHEYPKHYIPLILNHNYYKAATAKAAAATAPTTFNSSIPALFPVPVAPAELLVVEATLEEFPALTLVFIVAVALAVILGAEVITRLPVALASLDVVVIASAVVDAVAVAASVLVDAAAPGPYPGR
jgi:hypothetical protein